MTYAVAFVYLLHGYFSSVSSPDWSPWMSSSSLKSRRRPCSPLRIGPASCRQDWEPRESCRLLAAAPPSCPLSPISRPSRNRRSSSCPSCLHKVRHHLDLYFTFWPVTEKSEHYCAMLQISWSAAVLRIRDVYPGSDFFSSRILDTHQRILVFYSKIMVSKLSEIWSRLFISDPNPGSGSWLFTRPGSRIQASKMHRIPDPDPQHWSAVGGKKLNYQKMIMWSVNVS